MHLKNFSLIEEQPGSRVFGLSAAYDLLPVNLLMPEDTEETALTLNGKKKNLRKKDFLALAQNMGIREKTACGLMNQLLNRTEVFRDIAEESCLSKELKEAMKHLIRTRTDVLA